MRLLQDAQVNCVSGLCITNTTITTSWQVLLVVVVLSLVYDCFDYGLGGLWS